MSWVILSALADKEYKRTITEHVDGHETNVDVLKSARLATAKWIVLDIGTKALKVYADSNIAAFYVPSVNKTILTNRPWFEMSVIKIEPDYLKILKETCL